MSNPSRTSQAVAMARAGLERPSSENGDPSAQSALVAGMAPAAIPALMGHLAARTHFVDSAVAAALGRGVRQVVILGAGYDDRALRFRTPSVRFFEVDHPDTQADKRRRLATIDATDGGPVLVAADFRDDDVAMVLAAAGHDSAAATLFVCEGLLVYLDETTIVRLLAALRTRATPDSLLAASLAIHPDGLDSRAVTAERNAARRTAAAEPWRTILPAADHCRLLLDADWAVTVESDDQAVDASAPPGRSLLVTADPVY